MIYENKAAEEEDKGVKGDNCANVDFDKLQVRSEGELEDREVGGLALNTAEHAEVHLHDGGNKEDEEN